jgi:DNA polymerase-3 subunit alpha
MTAFVHLSVHSEFSMVDGLVTVPALVEKTQAMGGMAVAITDHCGLFGLVKFYQKALKAGVKPITAADLLLRDEEDETQVSVIRLLCLNETGYRNLTCLISKGYTEGQASGQPIVEWSWVVEHNEGLLALSAGSAGEIGQALCQDNMALAEKYLAKWQACFDQQRCYLELHRAGREQDELHVSKAVALAEKQQVPVVATNDVRFISPEDFEAHEARVCIHDGETLSDPRRVPRYSKEQYLKTPEQMVALFQDIPEAIANALEIAKRCTVTLDLGRVCLPQFPIPEGTTLADYFTKVSEEGLQARLGDAVTDAYRERLHIELDVIIKMGFPGYFLIVADFIAWAKSQDIPVGPGRGSGAGSLVAYVLGITELDPLQHELLFERFLNPERVSMPDFDIDFCMERRDQVIDYVAGHYGRDCVSQIITFGTMAAKAVVRDVGRVMGMPYGFVDKLAKLIPFELGMTLDKALRQEEDLMKRYQQEDEVRDLIDLALKLEGITRNAGKHAGGVVIAPTKLTDFSPLYCEPDGSNVVTQFDKNDVESAGLVKFDFLGLRTLTIIQWAIEHIEARHAETLGGKLDIGKIPTDDEKSFDLLKRCETSAVFQLESRGMKDLIKRLQPDCFDDITALVALFRPGPLQSGMVDDFIDRKHGLAQVEYPHPKLEPILKPTYGVILYQEQVMQIAQVLAGYSLGGADILRRAMGKKKPEEMAKQRTIFVEGSVERGVDKDLATAIFDLMEKFAGYGFNKSHSAAYALIAYQTAWLKAHYPAEFMAAVLSSDMDNTDKVVGFYQECERMGLKVNMPDINLSQPAFTVNDAGEVVYGLGAIKGVGMALIEGIVAERQAAGPYQDLFDFCERSDTRKLNRRALEAFIAAGAMDSWGTDRGILVASIDAALKYASQQHQNSLQGQDDLFAMPANENKTRDVTYSNVPPWPFKKRLQAEYDVLGMYMSGHPLQAYTHEIKSFASGTIRSLRPAEGKKSVLAGMIVSARQLTTKSGRRMAIATVEDATARIDVAIFSKVFDSVKDLLIKGKLVVVKGEISHDDFTGGFKCVADEMTLLEQARERMAKRLKLRLSEPKDMQQLLSRLSQVISPYCGGACPVNIVYTSPEATAELQLGTDWRVRPDDELLESLAELCDVPAVVEYQ